MKLRLPCLLRAILLSVIAFSASQTAYSFDFGAVVENEHSKPVGKGGFFYSNDGKFSYDSYESLWFEGNSASMGGVGYMEDAYKKPVGVSLTNNGNMTFKSNKALAARASGGDFGGGVFYSYEGSINLTGNGDILFDGNEALGEANGLGADGGAIWLDSKWNGGIDIKNNRDVTFSSNRAKARGGAIYSTYSNIFISGNRTVTFAGNSAMTAGMNSGYSGRGGAIYLFSGYVIFEQNEKLVFSGNTAADIGGAIYSRAGVSITGNGEVEFSGNKSGTVGSAIASGMWMDISGNGKVSFLNNETTGEGAALYFAMMEGFRGTPVLSQLSADNGDIVFDGNVRNKGTANESRLGMLGVIDDGSDTYYYPDGSNDVVLKMKAKGGASPGDVRSIYFYDAFYLAKFVNNNDGASSLTVEMNKEAGYTGNIVLSGEKNGGKTLESMVSGDVQLYQGTLAIRNNAKLSLADVQTTSFGYGGYVQTNVRRDFYGYDYAVLEMTGKGGMLAGKFDVKSHTVLRTGSGATLDADSVRMSQGVTFDISPFLDSKDSGLSVTANSWLLGGDIRLSDTLDYNGDDRWASDQKFLLMGDVNGSRGEADFSGIVSDATNSDYIGEGYAYKGNWSYEWVDGNLYAVWVRERPLGGELWWDGEGSGEGNGLGTWNQDTSNKVWNLDAPNGPDFGFQDMDIVHFTRSGVVNIEGFVEVNGNVMPGGIIDVHFNDGKGELIWQGPGAIVGRASLEKYGTGVLVIRTDNTFSGGTDMYGGTIRVESKTGLGTGDVTLHGGLIDLAHQNGVGNDIRVVGEDKKMAALAGFAQGSVVVEKINEGDTEAVLHFLGGTSFFTSLGGHAPLVADAVLVNGASSVSVHSGATLGSYINLNGPAASLNLLAGNGGTSLITGGVLGSGSFNVLGGNHRIDEADSSHGQVFDGTVNIKGGQLTVSSRLTYKDVVMTGGIFVADDVITFDNLQIGSGLRNKETRETSYISVLSGAEMNANDVLVSEKSTLYVDGVFNARGETHVEAGGEVYLASGSRAISWGKVYSADKTETQETGMITLNEGSTWNANGGFDAFYVDARTGNLTIGSDSIIREKGYFYAENVVYGTDENGSRLDLNTPLEDLPVLTISKGATFWAGNTVKYGDGTYETQTGFYCVTLDIDALVTIGTFVVRDYASDGIVTHDNIVHSMKRAFEPKLVDGQDLRNYLYVLKQDVTFSSGHVRSNEQVHVEKGAGAVVENTSGALLNLGGQLTVNAIDETTGTVTAAGGKTDLTGATSDLNKIHFIGSVVSTATGTSKDTSAEIKLVENNSTSYVVTVDTVQAQIGETTKVGENALVAARNFIISGEKTKLDNEKGTLEVAEEVTLAKDAAYKVGKLDRFGWVNMDKGELNLTQSAWQGITLGSYSGATSDTGAKVRLNEHEANNVDAKDLTVVGGGEHTFVKQDTKVSTDRLAAGTGSLLDVAGGDVLVREALVFETGVNQIGRIQLAMDPEKQRARGRMSGYGMADAVQVMMAGGNHVGHMDSSSGTAQFHNSGFNNVDHYSSVGKDGWVFVLTDGMLDQQDPLNAITQIAGQTGNALSNIVLDTSKLTKSYFGDIQLYSDNITLTSGAVDYGDASGVYNQKDAIKNFRYVNPLVPEVGDITLNSLWTMVSAMDSFSSAVMGQMDFSPYRQHLAKNIWAKGLYMNENIGNALPGYRKDSGGYAIGADTLLNAKNLIGVSFAQMLGTEMTNRHMAEDEQNIMMAALYGRHLFEACDKGSTTLDFMIGYGRGDNDGTFYKNGASSFSNWKSDVFNAEIKLTCYRKLTDRVWVNPYVGGEFVFAEHKSHYIHGAAGDFDVSRSRMHALRLPIGATVEFKTTSSVTNYIGASYVPDVLRRNPGATVINGMLSQRVGDVSVGRNAARVYTGCTWQMDKQWLINLNYEVETASQKVNQMGRVTTSYSF